MKTFIMILALMSALFTTLAADDAIRDLGKVKVVEVKYLRNGLFCVTLARAPSPGAKSRPAFFDNKATLSFDFHPDTLDGVLVISTPNRKITRKDLALKGPSFMNLLLSKLATGEELRLSCGFKTIVSDKSIVPNKYVLSYYQVNRTK